MDDMEFIYVYIYRNPKDPIFEDDTSNGRYYRPGPLAEVVGQLSKWTWANNKKKCDTAIKVGGPLRSF